MKMINIMSEWRQYISESEESGKEQEEIDQSYPETVAMAHHYHRDQVRRSSGMPYVQHPKEVAAIIKKYYQNSSDISSEEFNQMMNVALLHDTIEDAHKNLPNDLARSKRKLDSLLAQGSISQDAHSQRMAQISHDAQIRVMHDIGSEHGISVLNDVQSLSHDDSMTYSQYVSAISDDPILIRVKLADMLHNSRDLSPPDNWDSKSFVCNDTLKGWEKYRCSLMSLIEIHGGKPLPISDSHWLQLKKAFNL